MIIKVPSGTDLTGPMPGDEWWNETAGLNEYMLGTFEHSVIRESMWKQLRWSKAITDAFRTLPVPKCESGPVVYRMEGK